MLRRICLFIVIMFVFSTQMVGITYQVIPAEATNNTVPSTHIQQLPAPHLDYGIHVAPYTNVDVSLVDSLRMPWVKLYTVDQIRQFPGKRILFRLDVNWTNDWENFRRNIQARVRELSDLGVDAIEVHNEPNLGIEWNGQPDAWQYTQVLRVVYTEIKQINPTIVVVSGGLAPTLTTPNGRSVDDLDFARVMFENNASDYFDVFGYHPYGYNAPPEQAPSPDTLNFRRVELIRELMREHNINKQIWLTEFGWLRDPSEDGVSCSRSDPNIADFVWMLVDGRTQGDYIVRAFAYADRHWSWAGPTFVWNLNWSMIPTNTLHPCSHMRWFALLTADGRPTSAFNSVAAMPRRPAPWIPGQIPGIGPEMVLVADDMTVEVGVNCLGWVPVGQFEITNEGSGSFIATIEPAVSLSGPAVEVSPEVAEIDDVVTVFADTTDLIGGYYPIYINVSTTIDERIIRQTVRGYIIITESYAACQ